MEFIASALASFVQWGESSNTFHDTKESEPLPRDIHKDYTLTGGRKQLGKFSVSRCVLSLAVTISMPHEVAASFLCHQPQTISYLYQLSIAAQQTTQNSVALNDYVILLLVVWIGDLGRAAWRQLISVPRMVMAEVTDWGQRIQDGFTHMSGTSVGYAGWDLAESPSLSPSPSLLPFIISYPPHMASPVR